MLLAAGHPQEPPLRSSLVLLPLQCRVLLACALLTTAPLCWQINIY
jgi:hypothetical protein